jgi:prolyl oligopeptidase PreP (S9A serine peptidase family)
VKSCKSCNHAILSKSFTGFQDLQDLQVTADNRIGSVGGFGGKRFDTETFYSLSSFNTPSTIFRYDMKTAPASRPQRSAKSSRMSSGFW